MSAQRTSPCVGQCFVWWGTTNERLVSIYSRVVSPADSTGVHTVDRITCIHNAEELPASDARGPNYVKLAAWERITLRDTELRDMSRMEVPESWFRTAVSVYLGMKREQLRQARSHRPENEIDHLRSVLLGKASEPKEVAA